MPDTICPSLVIRSVGRGLVVLAEVDRGLRGRFFKMADFGAEKVKDVE